MSSTEHWMFSFRFDRRGMTRLWELEAADRDKVKDGSGRPPEGVRFQSRQERLVWIRVSKMLSPGYDMEDEFDEAEDRAREYFKQNYPDDHLVP